MASEVDICNLALAYLGDEATVAGINPPEGSVQAEYCARFYPFARDSLLELHTWGFATKCAQLAAMGISRPEWRFAYAQPADAIKIVAVLPHDAANIEAGIDNAQPFSCEIDNTGADIILTNQVNAVARYISLVKDTTKFSPLFVQALAWHLASMLAGPLLKGDVGAAESKRCVGAMQAYLSQAMVSDANQRKTKPAHMPDWMRARGAGFVDGNIPGLPNGWRG
ncbi:hypothetical protein [Bordetella hinzii]|uniref:hypothetical protein n=1 Tax=Bordetella hinzii TaxID=103855 RepID=UPI0039FD4A45